MKRRNTKRRKTIRKYKRHGGFGRLVKPAVSAATRVAPRFATTRKQYATTLARHVNVPKLPNISNINFDPYVQNAKNFGKNVGSRIPSSLTSAFSSPIKEFGVLPGEEQYY